MTRNRWIGIGVIVLIAAFMIGFLPQWAQNRALSDELDRADLRIELLEHQGRVGAALAEAHRGNHERARQQMAVVLPGLDRLRPQLTPAQVREIDAVLADREELITLLARASPESTTRLAQAYTRIFRAVQDGESPGDATTTPPPAAETEVD